MKTAKQVHFLAGDRAGKVLGLLVRPAGARCLLVLAHGAGAGMRHSFMEAMAQKLGAHGVATFRYQFPYMERGARRPDPEAVLVATVRAAVSAAAEHARGLPLFAGGKSMGGRMTSIAAARGMIEQALGLIYFGFPLHAAGRPSATRGEQLLTISRPMLFVSGTRDALADLTLLQALCMRLGKVAELFLIDGGDHSFHVLKSSGRSDDQILDEVAQKVDSWTARQVA